MAAIDDELWNPLLGLIESGNVIPVVGQDLLQVEADGRTLPFYSLIATRLAEKLETTEGLSDRFPLNGVATKFLEHHGEAARLSYLLNGIVNKESASLTEPPKAIQQLASITAFKLFVTTTFDSLLEEAINTKRSDGEKETEVLFYESDRECQDIREPLPRLARPTVYHLLGKLSPMPVYVVTEEDALEFVHSLHRRRPEALFSELAGKSLLIVGCSFPTWLVRVFLRITRTRRLRYTPDKIDFIVDPDIRDDRLLVDFLRSCNTGIEIFQTLTPVEFVAELHKRWSSRTPPPVGSKPPHSPVEQDAIFVSYAREDLAAATRVFERLKAAKLPVWFDKEQLFAGDDFRTRIKLGIQRASFFIPVLSEASVRRTEGFWRDEWLEANLKDRQRPETLKFFLPLKVDGLRYDDADLPGFLRDRTWDEAPGGDVSPTFVTKVTDLFQQFKARKSGRGRS